MARWIPRQSGSIKRGDADRFVELGDTDPEDIEIIFHDESIFAFTF
jgi:hypothetical protein